MARMRYIVNDVAAAIDFYTGLLGFELKQDFRPAVGIIGKDDLELVLAGGGASASRPMPDGRQPDPAAGTGSCWMLKTLRRRWLL